MPENPVAIPSIGYNKMASKWDLLSDLLGGTKAMRLAGEKWLPKEPGESALKYLSRVDRSVLYNGFKDTLGKLSDKPFSRPVSVSGLPEELSYLLDDVDSNNTSFEDFAHLVLYHLIRLGVVHIFVDHSIVEPVVKGEVTTKRDEEERGARVLLSCIPADSLIGWQFIKEANKIKLTQIRILQDQIEPVGDFGDVLKKYIKVVTRENWTVWEHDSKKDLWSIKESGVHTFGRIPLISIYANKSGLMMADPPLEDLAWMNLMHWQSYSDQRNILRLSRFGILFGKGMPKSMTEANEIELGPTRAFMSDSEHADMKFVEVQGNSISLGQKDLEDIEMKMEILGNMPLVKQHNRLATSVRIDTDRNSSLLQCWIRALERALSGAIGMAAEWRKIQLKDPVSVDIYSDFETAMLGSDDAEFMLKIKAAGEISQETFLREIKRRGKLSDSVDVAEEMDRIANEVKTELEPFMAEEVDEDIE